MSFILGTVTLVFLVLLLAGRILTVLELRSLEQQYRRNLRAISELGEALDTSRRKYLVALKAEGVSKQKLAHMKTRLANVRQHLEQIERTAAERQEREQEQLEHSLEVIVMKALGGPSARRDSHFRRVMKVIKGLIDLEKQNDSEELVTLVQEKLAEMGQAGDLATPPAADPAASAPEVPPAPDATPSEAPGEGDVGRAADGPEEQQPVGDEDPDAPSSSASSPPPEAQRPTG